MCFYVGADKEEFSVSDEPITVFKSMEITKDNKLRSPYYSTGGEYEFGINYTAKDANGEHIGGLEQVLARTTRRYYVINEGFHSCTSSVGASFMSSRNSVIVQCEIPAKTPYLYDDCEDEWVSHRIKFIKILPEPEL